MDKEKTIETGAIEEVTEPSREVPTRDRLVGRTVADRYRIDRRLARGGMGVVYLATHLKLKRTVVFKVLSVHLSGDDAAIARFEREATGLSALDHPHIVTVFDYGHEEADDLTYLVMEYVEGETLGQVLKRNGRLTFDQFLPIAAQTIEAVAHAHSEGIVHRDVKPANIMVSDRGGRPWVKVLDFGLARNVSSSVDITQGKLVGTVSYVAPEIVTGQKGDEASDVYALGVMFYYLLSGRKPFAGADEMSVLYQHVNVLPDPLDEQIPQGDVPDDVIDLIHRCMAKNPAARPVNAQAMLNELADLVSFPSFTGSLSGISIERTPAPRHMTPFQPGKQVPGRAEYVTSRERPSSKVEASSDRLSSPSIVVQRSTGGWTAGVLSFLVVFAVVIAAAAYFKSTQTPAQVAGPAEPVETPAVAAAPTMATVRVVATPVGAIEVDGESRGTTPFDGQLEPGRHLIRVTAEGHEPWQQWIDLEAGATQAIDVSLLAVAAEEEAPDAGSTAEIRETSPADAAKPAPRRTVKTRKRVKSATEAPTEAPSGTAEPNRSRRTFESDSKQPKLFGDSKDEKDRYFK